MNTLDKISKLLKEQGKTQKDLTDFLQMSQVTFSEWKKGKSKSYMKYLPKIASFLKVSVDSLLDDADSIDLVPFNMSEHEKRLIAAYRNKPEMQASVDKLLDIESNLIEDGGQQRTSRIIYRAARSTDHAEPRFEERPVSDLEKLERATPVTSDDDL